MAVEAGAGLHDAQKAGAVQGVVLTSTHLQRSVLAAQAATARTAGRHSAAMGI